MAASTRSSRHLGQRPESPGCVTIFGAGIAGLTAAHELAERGFRVQVWEPFPDPRDPRRGLAVGGMARTQWSQVDWLDDDGDDGDASSRARASRASKHGPRRIPLPAPPPSGKAGPPYHRTRPIVPLLGTLYVCDPAWAPGLLLDAEPLVVEEGQQQDAAGTLSELEERARRRRAVEEEIRDRLRQPGSIEVLLVGLTRLGPQERAERIQYTADYLLGNARKPLEPRFDVEQQTYCVRVKKRTIVFPMREPEVNHPDTTAVVNHYPDTGSPQAYLLFREWRPGRIYGLSPAGKIDAMAVIDSFFDALLASGCSSAYVEVTTRSTTLLSLEDRRARVNAVRNQLAETLKERGIVLGIASSKGGWLNLPATIKRQTTTVQVNLMFVQLADTNHELPSRAVASISFRARERWLPGEHGHRFFPAFYHHVFDTMKRTPLLETVEKPSLAREQERAVGMSRTSELRYVETGRTLFDNLKPTTSHALAFAGQRPSVLPRRRIRSFRELEDHLRVFFSSEAEGGFEADPRDTTFFALKIFQYLTSSQERRKDYEQLSWWEYIEGDGYGPKFRELLQRWPQALVAMNAKSADARTNGTTTVQILLDMLRIESDGYRDGILKGPTNEAWLEPWRRYLEAQGVEFIHGEIEGFEVRTLEDRRVVWPQVACYEPRYPMNEHYEPQLMPGYFVLALPAYEAARIARLYRKALEAYPGLANEDSDLARTAGIDTSGLFDERGRALPLQGDGNAEFRHYAGIQFYFDQDVLWLDGQVYHPSSAWGLTSVSQARFWEDKMDWEHGYRGVLSVIIADWKTPSPFTGKPASEHKPHELAIEVWRQLKEGLQGPRPLLHRGAGAGFDSLPDPIYWHLDDNLEYREKDGGGGSAGEKSVGKYYNKSPFHIVPPGKWRTLPGELDAEGYGVENGFVVCGMFTKTHTRIPSMEAANESARHAVNAILRHSEYTGSNTACDVWSPEEREVDDFAWMKDLDRRLRVRANPLPHFTQIFGFDRLVREALRGGARDPFDPVNLWWSVTRWLTSFRPPTPGARS